MLDIVERLTSLGDVNATGERSLARLAADEITWLRKENARLTAELGKAHSSIIPWIKKAGSLEAELDLIKHKLVGTNV